MVEISYRGMLLRVEFLGRFWGLCYLVQSGARFHVALLTGNWWFSLYVTCFRVRGVDSIHVGKL